MRKRNRANLPTVWLHIDMTKPGAAALLEICRNKHETDKGWKLSVNYSRDGFDALVKVAEANKAWANSIGASPLVQTVYDETDHHFALDLVNTAEWLPLPE